MNKDNVAYQMSLVSRECLKTKDKARWLGMFAEDGIIEDPIGPTMLADGVPPRKKSATEIGPTTRSAASSTSTSGEISPRSRARSKGGRSTGWSTTPASWSEPRWTRSISTRWSASSA